MPTPSQLAVEITKGSDHLDIWVDANNNGERDDDDVNIYITSGGGFYTVSPTFKQALDVTIQERIKELALAMLTQPGGNSPLQADKLRQLALDLVLKATGAVEEPPADIESMKQKLHSFF